jgi:hypothetical protein
VKYEAGESRTRTTKTEEGSTAMLSVDYMLATTADSEGNEIELYAEAEPAEGDETATYDNLKAEILCQANEFGIDPEILRFPYDDSRKG